VLIDRPATQAETDTAKMVAYLINEVLHAAGIRRIFV